MSEAKPPIAHHRTPSDPRPKRRYFVRHLCWNRATLDLVLSLFPIAVLLRACVGPLSPVFTIENDSDQSITLFVDAVSTNQLTVPPHSRGAADFYVDHDAGADLRTDRGHRYRYNTFPLGSHGVRVVVTNGPNRTVDVRFFERW